jgi:serine/threonine protein kinase
VYKAKERSTGKLVAVKAMLACDEREGVPATALREIAVLKTLDHPNIVK